MTFYSLPLAASRATTAPRRDVSRFVDDVFTGRLAGAWQPAVDAREDATGYSIHMDLPGVSPESVEVLAEDSTLTVRGNRPARALADNERLIFAEPVAGEFVRRFRLPKSADLQAVTASSANGVLQVRIAKVEPAQPRRVRVTVAAPAHAVATTRAESAEGAEGTKG